MSIELVDDIGNFTFYVLDYNDTKNIQETGDMNITEPIFMLQHIVLYTGVIEIASPGVYSILIITESTDMLTIIFTQSALRPPTMLLVLSTSFVLSGISLIFFEYLWNTRKHKNIDT
ncbi:MAG: hypothetical protein ACW968_07655 [Candidatus Thorarchaeota archaeon]